MENYKNDSINPGDGNLEISEIMEMNNVTKGELDRLVYMIQTQESLRELITHEYADVNKRVIEPYKIVDLQKVLNQKWTMKISETGIFTTETFMAIVAFQKENWYSASWMIQVDMKNWLFENYTKSNQKEEDSNEDYEDFMEEITGNKSDKLEKIQKENTSDYEMFMKEILWDSSYEKEMKSEKDENYEDFMKSFDIPNIIKSKEFKEHQLDLNQLDLRSLAKKYPNEASLKNNNPAGITYFPAFANTLTKHGVEFYKWTARPRSEWRNYFGFKNMEDGMQALDILWNIKLAKLAEQDFSDFAENWAVDTRSYRNEFGNIWNTKMKDLPDHEIQRIKIRQMRIESPGMYTELRKLDII